MKRLAALCLLMALLLSGCGGLEVTPPPWPVTVNGILWNGEPLLFYEDVAYLPLTAEALSALGLTLEEGDLHSGPLGCLRPGAEAHSAPRRVRPAGESITLCGEPLPEGYPLLKAGKLCYLPLTWEICAEKLGLGCRWDAETGLALETPAPPLPTYILHACGAAPDGQDKTNSVEAAQRSYDFGYRWLEVDFGWTADGELVCLHDWKGWRYHKGAEATTDPLTYAEFMTYLRGDGLTAFTPDSLAHWLEEHPGAVVVTDAKTRNLDAAALLAERYPHLRKRFAVQIYALEELEPVQALGFETVILTLYRLSYEDYHNKRLLTTFARESGVSAITMAAAEEVRDVFEALVETGIPVYVHTVNDPAEQADWLAAGAQGVYTDTGKG
ncbi:MAG: glycerophosphodiester phosphodiesterase family protein [bacterium]